MADTGFEWDLAKDRSNQVKHGVAFADAQRAFFDPSRIIAEDLGHGPAESRYFCFGRAGAAVLTVRSTWRDGRIRIFGAGFGEKEGRSMSERMVRYTKGEIGRIRVIDDFLPSPDELVPVEDNVKVTLTLTRRSLDFFKREAKSRRLPYQRMIRALVDQYAGRAAETRKKTR